MAARAKIALSLSPRKTNPVKVKIKYNSEDKCLKKIKPVTINVAAREEIVWTSKNARIEIQFEAQKSPFLVSRFRLPRGGAVHSGIPMKKHVTEQEYKYTATVIAINKPSRKKPSCLAVNMVPPVKPDKPLPTCEGIIRVQLKKDRTVKSK